MQINKNKVGEKIHQIRIHNGYSMEQFGKQIGDAPKGSVNSWEKGVNLPNKERLELIAIMGNMIVNELLYGSLSDYVNALMDTNLDVRVTNDFTDFFVEFLKSNGYTYGDDIEILRFLKGFFNYNSVITKRESLLYKPISEQDNLFVGYIHTRNPESIPEDLSKQKIRDYSEVIKDDNFTPYFFAFADKGNNTLHVMPYTLNETCTENYSYPPTLTNPGEHDYFTAGFIELKLALRDLTLIYYGLDSINLTPKISKFNYDAESDSLILHKGRIRASDLHNAFVKNIEKESLYLIHLNEKR